MKRVWHTVDVPKILALPRPVFLRSQALAARHAFPMHVHSWNQFVYATAGTLLVTLDDARYVITPEQGIWIPAGVRHTTAALDDVEFRNLYIGEAPDLGMPEKCSVLSVSPLLRLLIVEIAAIAQDADEALYRDRLDAVVLSQITRLRQLDFHLPWPRSSHLRDICEVLYFCPDNPRHIDDWAADAGLSSRTLARHFNAEVGMSLHLWRHRMRLFRAVEWLSAKRRVTDIALDLGFSSTSAFTYAFRREMGCSPTGWLTQHGGRTDSLFLCRELLISTKS
ncbi:AraC family transcriptional regulator [Ensifer sp. 22564]|uniref:AraC family transcriptional regulator n=1 Tax=Sinorhizobium/Ensifer group TaxID=227292 RepID=UPI003F848F94